MFRFCRDLSYKKDKKEIKVLKGEKKFFYFIKNKNLTSKSCKTEERFEIRTFPIVKEGFW